MNALVALLHFCEVHGPSVLFCTQAIHPSHHHASSTTATSTTPAPSSSRKPGSACPACAAQLPLVVTTDPSKPTEAHTLVTRDDEDPSVEYIGTPAPPQQLHLYKAVRLACVRSLTAEFCPGREGPVLFGDEENGYVLSYLFKLRDAQARGEVRFYSLMLLMTDRVFLISCWPFFVSVFRSMAINLQERADAIFQREREVRERYPPFRRVAPMSQDPFFRRPSQTALRSLADILGTKDIYLQIHAQFSYILKLSARKRVEKIAPGRSASAAYLKMRDGYFHDRNNQAERQGGCSKKMAALVPTGPASTREKVTAPTTISNGVPPPPHAPITLA